MEARHQHTLADVVVMHLDRALRTVCGRPPGTGRPDPADTVTAGQQGRLTVRERWQATGVMRAHHAGEVATQGLYHGQALSARDTGARDALERTAEEDSDHLRWCDDRIRDLGGRTSRFNPCWYLGSVLLGATAGTAGYRWGLGVAAETHRQTVHRLADQLARLPAGDRRSRVVLEQIKADEAAHAAAASAAGAHDLPDPLKSVLGLASQVVTRTSYWL